MPVAVGEQVTAETARYCASVVTGIFHANFFAEEIDLENLKCLGTTITSRNSYLLINGPGKWSIDVLLDKLRTQSADEKLTAFVSLIDVPRRPPRSNSYQSLKSPARSCVSITLPASSKTRNTAVRGYILHIIQASDNVFCVDKVEDSGPKVTMIKPFANRRPGTG